MVAVYLGESNEDNINNMSYIFFNDVLKQLGKRINYQAVVNLAGNSFAKNAWKEIEKANPMRNAKKKGSGFESLFDTIKVVKPVKGKEAPSGFDWINNAETYDLEKEAKKHEQSK